jgi:hypothetical protein
VVRRLPGQPAVCEMSSSATIRRDASDVIADSERDTDNAGLLVLHADHRFGACPALLRHPIFVCTTFPLGTLGLSGSAARAVPV